MVFKYQTNSLPFLLALDLDQLLDHFLEVLLNGTEVLRMQKKTDKKCQIDHLLHR